MGTPDKTDTPATIDLDTEVNNLIEKLADPEWKPGDDDNPALVYAARTEKRRRDTQGEFTKNQQKLKATELRATRLEERLSAAIMESLPLKEQASLEELKNTDPDAWRATLDRLETNAKGELAKELKTITEESSNLSEKERRDQVFNTFLEANPGITGEMLDEDVPPRFAKKLASGEFTFEQFLEESAKFLKANKVIATGDKAPDFDDLATAAGGSKPGEDDTNQAAKGGYEKEVY